MKEFTSCFVGIPLPDKYQPEFEDLLNDLSLIDPTLGITEPTIPHITGYYLDEQSQLYLPEIAETVRSKVHLLRNAALTVGGMGTFGSDEPTVLFLDVKYPEALKEFNQEITGVLHNFYAADNNLPYHPHMTVARRYDSKVPFTQVGSKIKQRMDQISWTFPVNEVVLYGVDSRKQPEHQEKLIHIPVI